MSQEFSHVPVLLDEVIAAIVDTPELPVIDATLGGAGHAKAILEALPNRKLIGLDQDYEAISVARERLLPFGDRVLIHHARFDEIARVASEDGVKNGGASAVLFDLGVSSYQLDTAARGFSYHNDGPLDMRMDASIGVTAAQFLDDATEDELSALFYVHGETRFARRIARAIIADRPLHSTSALADLVARVIPIPARRRGHPARRVFQALRVAVNSELDVLGPALDDAIDLLAPGGRIIVLSYHSGEDKITKDHFLYGETGGCQCPPMLPCVCGAVSTLRLLNRGARKASPDEISRNPRAESVRLRIAERLVTIMPTGQN
jgi:16S rRNA (cytosine1402-N4)-methyltransferase